MKKLVSFCLAVIMIFTILPVCAFAADNAQSEQEQLFARAREVFPEYASLIHRNDVATYSALSGENPIVFTETRDISDTESMTIALYANSDVVIVDKTYDYVEPEKEESSTTVGSDVIGSASFTVSCTTASGEFQCKGVGFIFNQNGKKYFTSYGTTHTSNGLVVGRSTTTTTDIQHPLTFNAFSPKKVYLNFHLYFSGNNLHLELK